VSTGIYYAAELGIIGCFLTPFSGCLFLFRNRSGTEVKILCYDSQRFWLCLKRISRGRLGWWPDAGSNAITQLAPGQLLLLLYNGNPDSARMAERCKAAARLG
jgi:transposase